MRTNHGITGERSHKKKSGLYGQYDLVSMVLAGIAVADPLELDI
jgi:hypothetical protein